MDLLQFFYKQKYCDVISSHTVICDLLTVEEPTDRDSEKRKRSAHMQSLRAQTLITVWSGRSWHDGDCQSQACERLTLISYSLTSSTQLHHTRGRWFILHDNYEF